jgi:phosphoenolpyruvate synthase/pyruvate phosphate dikinase
MVYSMSMIVDLAEASAADRAVLGGKAATLAELSAAGFAVPPGIIVTADALDEPDLDGQLEAAAARLGGDRFAVRSSGAAEDLPDASYAGLYESYLNVPAEQLGAAVRRCFAAAASERVAAYHEHQAACRQPWRCWYRRWLIPLRPVWRSPHTRSPATGPRRW